MPYRISPCRGLDHHHPDSSGGRLYASSWVDGTAWPMAVGIAGSALLTLVLTVFTLSSERAESETALSGEGLGVSH